ncbi:MAG: hypothetical protein DMG93_02870 [Acidobacteria bacterium]|nr:MAG: hypothetical protein DMG93_02870 [Acidobacteriota bacterium]
MPKYHTFLPVREEHSKHLLSNGLWQAEGYFFVSVAVINSQKNWGDDFTDLLACFDIPVG